MPTDAQLLAEVEELIRTAPSTGSINKTESFGWLGRVSAAMKFADSMDRLNFEAKVQGLTIPSLAVCSYQGVMVALNAFRSDLILRRGGSVGAAVALGQTFDYFDEVRKTIELASCDLMIVDPYLDAEFVSRYLPQVRHGCSVRLLTSSKRSASLIAALSVYQQQTPISVQVGLDENLHDRYILVDGNSGYQSGASFKDGGKNAPTTFTQILDAFVAVRDTYEAKWTASKKVSF